MIGIVDVEVQCQNPNMPLYPMRAFVSSPTSIRVRKVPKRIGKWAIESVQFVAAYPDGSIKTAQCVLTGGVWVGTIEGTSTSGTSTNGYTIFASGTDENGNAVTGYILGKGDIEILEGDGTITPGEDVAYVHLLEEESQTPKDGDLYPTEEGYKIWQDGEAHELGTNLTDKQIDTLDADVERRETIVKLQGDITKTFYWTGTVTKQTLADAELYDQTQQTFADIIEIDFGTGVETIDSQLFMGCTTLEKVKFPSSLVEVKTAAFKNCANLWSITFPKCYTNKDGGKWGNGIFEGCAGLATVEIPASMKSIPAKTFYGCANLSNVSISNGVEDIGSRAFMGTAQYGYSQIYIPSSVRRIGIMAFANSKMSHVVLNEGLEVIEDGTFNGCTNLMEITIPSTAAYLQDDIFAGCTLLQKIVFKGKSFHDLTDNPKWPHGLTTAQQALVETFNDRIVDGNGNIIRADKTCKSGSTWNWYVSGTNRMIGTKTDSYYINEEETQKYVLQYSDSPLGWTCSTYTKSGDDWVLQNSELITSVTNPSYLCFSTLSTDMAWLQSSEDEILATQNWVSAQDYVDETELNKFPDETIIWFSDGTVERYNWSGNMDMYKLMDAGLREWDATEQTFVWLKNPVKVVFGNLITNISDSFRNATQLTTVIMSDTITGISHAFHGCTSLSSVRLSQNLKTIEALTFEGCSSLTNISLPMGLEILYGGLGGTGITNLVVPETVKTLSLSRTTVQFVKISDAKLQYSTSLYIENCAQLTSIDLGKRVSYIYSLKNNSALTTITIPESVTNIGQNAFQGCTALSSVVFEGKTLTEVQGMSRYPWGISDTSIISVTNNATKEWTEQQIHNPTITLTQGGTTKGSFTLNQSSNQTIALDAGGGGGGGHTVTVRYHQADGDDSGGDININGFNVKAASSGTFTVNNIDVGTTTTLTFHGQDYIHVPSQPDYGMVFVNGSNTSNQIVTLTGDTNVDLYWLQCIKGGTIVSLADGTTKPIEEITYDDDLLVWNFDEGKIGSAKPSWIKREDYIFYSWETTLASGKKISTCGRYGHRFFDLGTNTWVYADNINGKTIYTIDGADAVVSSQMVEGKVFFYNIITKNHINLFGNGILLGCSLENYLYPVENMKFVKDNRTMRPYSEFEGEVPEWWYNECRYAESNASRDYLVKYCKDRLPIMLPRS